MFAKVAGRSVPPKYNGAFFWFEFRRNINIHDFGLLVIVCDISDKSDDDEDIAFYGYIFAPSYRILKKKSDCKRG